MKERVHFFLYIQFFRKEPDYIAGVHFLNKNINEEIMWGWKIYPKVYQIYSYVEKFLPNLLSYKDVLQFSIPVMPSSVQTKSHIEFCKSYLSHCCWDMYEIIHTKHLSSKLTSVVSAFSLF